MLSRAVLGDRQPPRLTTALGGGQGKGEGLPPGAKTMGFGMQRSTKSSRNLLDPPADDSGTNEGEMAGGSCKAEGSRRTASPHPSDQISAVVGSADTSAAAPPSPDSIGCWHAFEFGALYCESYSAESVRLLRKQQKRTHQLCCAWLANRQQLLEAFEAADEASANGGVSVDSSGGDDGRPRSDEARSDGPRKPARGVLTLGEMSSIAAEVAFSSATTEARHVHTEARHVHRFLMQLARLKSPLMPEAISMLLSLGSFDPPPDLSGAKSGAVAGAVAGAVSGAVSWAPETAGADWGEMPTSAEIEAREAAARRAAADARLQTQLLEEQLAARRLQGELASAQQCHAIEQAELSERVRSPLIALDLL